LVRGVRRRRHRRTAYLLLAGAIRFSIEFVRVDQMVLGVFTVAHLAALGAMVVGSVLLLTRADDDGHGRH
jgi:prolipoprotein diacylglyceryltransferase